MKILKKIILLFVAINGERTKIGSQNETYKNFEFLVQYCQEIFIGREPHQCNYTNGFPGHPKVKPGLKNPAGIKQIKKTGLTKADLVKECRKFCDNRNTCQVFAVNPQGNPHPLCYTFTYKNFKNKDVTWESNGNTKWVSLA